MKHVIIPMVRCRICAFEFRAEPEAADKDNRFTCERCTEEIRWQENMQKPRAKRAA